MDVVRFEASLHELAVALVGGAGDVAFGQALRVHGLVVVDADDLVVDHEVGELLRVLGERGDGCLELVGLRAMLVEGLRLRFAHVALLGLRGLVELGGGLDLSRELFLEVHLVSFLRG